MRERNASGVSRAQRQRVGKTAQKPARRKHRPARSPAHASGDRARAALRYLPLAFKLSLAVALGLIVFVGYRKASSASFFDVKTVDVEGTRRVSEDEVREAVLAMSKSGVWHADLDKIGDELREMPWVRDVVVARVLPAGLRVRVREREPRVVARTSQGRFVWLDEDGVILGAASTDADDFFIRGIEEGRTQEAREHNRERVALALELKREWERNGLSNRVSEVNLEDLRDVRVQLAGADAGVEVRIGGGDYASLFDDAVRVLDRERDTPRGRNVSYIVMMPGKSPIFGYPPEVRASSGNSSSDDGERDSARPSSSSATPSTAPATGANAARRAPVANPEKKRERATEKKRERTTEEKRDAATQRDDGALRPRRVG